MSDTEIKVDEAVEAADALSAVMEEELGVNTEFSAEEESGEKDTPTTDEAVETPADDTVSGKAEEKTEAPQVDDSLLERAVKAGIPLAKAKGFTSENLEAAVDALEAARPSTKPADDDQAGEKKEVEKVSFDDLKEEGFDERLVDRLNKIAQRQEQLEAENSTLKQELSQRGSADTQANEARALADFDGRIGSLGEDFKEVFGDGGFNSVNGSALEQRQAVLAEMGAMAEGYKATGRQLPDIQKLFERAVYNVTGKVPSQKAAEDPIPGKLAAQAKRVVGKPSSTTKQNTVAGELNQALGDLENALGR